MSKIDKRMRPAVPAIPKTMASAESTFSAVEVFLTSRPVCRSQRSEAKARSRNTVVTQQPAMKSGFRPSAPISEM